MQDDAEQTDAAKSFVGAGAWVSHLVLAEAAWVLGSVYALPPSTIATAIEMLLEHESLTLQDRDTVGAALDSFMARPALGFSDCLILEIARKAGHLPLGTFDRRLAKLDGAFKV